MACCPFKKRIRTHCIKEIVLESDLKHLFQLPYNHPVVSNHFRHIKPSSDRRVPSLCKISAGASIDILLKPIDLVFDACSLQSGVDSSRLCHCVSIPAPVGNAAFALHAPLHIRGHGGRTIVTCTLHYVHYAHSLLLRPVVSVLCYVDVPV